MCVRARLVAAGKEKEGARVESVPMKEEEAASLKEEGASLKQEEGASFTRPDLRGGRGHPSHGIRVTTSDIRVAESKNRLGYRDRLRS